MRTISLLFFSTALILTSCGNNYNEQDAIKWFNENKELAIEIRDKMLACPNIKRVTPGTRLEIVPKYGDFEPKDIKIYRELERIAKKEHFEFVTLSREGNTIENDFIDFSITVYSTGIVSRGRLIDIAYFRSEEIASKFNGIWRMLPLGEKGWYVVVKS